MKSLRDLPESEKINQLMSTLENYGSVLVAFSGGVDSSFLLKAAVDFLGTDRVLAITASSSIFPNYERENASKLAKRLGVDWRSIQSSRTDNPKFRENPPDRCYFCKKELFENLKSLADREGINKVVDGSIQGDSEGHRPGIRAAEELGIASPLQEAGLTKDEVRDFSKQVGLETWNKPSFACLATRFPYGKEITEEKLNRVGRAEEFLMELGINQFRVRHHGDIARIEVRRPDFDRLLDFGDKIVSRFKGLGYDYVTLDLEGYRTGSMNEPD
ncbi:ATP-dependent sacrificial sulfur transferase LarE [Candidatus Bipolaricaulota bacterium]|nr:ATP-dependent sacrificial sulfur transferase LarE [Candidatus Bipolaricaulota bacterium]